MLFAQSTTEHTADNPLGYTFVVSKVQPPPGAKHIYHRALSRNLPLVTNTKTMLTM